MVILCSRYSRRPAGCCF